MRADTGAASERFSASSYQQVSESRAWALIDLSALQHNLATARLLAPGCRALCVIKANGYGHGLVPVATALLAQADAYAVATLEEAESLRLAGIELPLVCLSAFWRRQQVALLERYRVSPVVHNRGQVEWLEERNGSAMDMWLKIDTGMHRIGVAAKEAAMLFARLRRAARGGTVRLMTHFANADDLKDNYTSLQQQRFEKATEEIDVERSLANSAAIAGWPGTHADWIRPGIMLYGASPLLDLTAQELDILPVMYLQARLIATHNLAKGEPVGYGTTWRAPSNTRIGVVGCGYGDGYPRCVGSGAKVSLHGRRAPIVGRVSMDMITIDLDGVPQAEVGDTVQLWGDRIAVDEVAGWAATIAYELTCKITPRVPRLYMEANHGA